MASGRSLERSTPKTRSSRFDAPAASLLSSFCAPLRPARATRPGRPATTVSALDSSSTTTAAVLGARVAVPGAGGAVPGAGGAGIEMVVRPPASPRRRAIRAGRSSRTWRTKAGLPLTSISRSPSRRRTTCSGGAMSPPRVGGRTKGRGGTKPGRSMCGRSPRSAPGPAGRSLRLRSYGAPWNGRRSSGLTDSTLGAFALGRRRARHDAVGTTDRFRGILGVRLRGLLLVHPGILVGRGERDRLRDVILELRRSTEQAVRQLGAQRRLDQRHDRSGDRAENDEAAKAVAALWPHRDRKCLGSVREAVPGGDHGRPDALLTSVG